MTDDAPPELQGSDAGEGAPPPTTGAVLAQARAAAGLSIEEVAAQLKLAPRQVVAIERDDFASLPGRTFVRGFVRNYARALKLDVDATLAALPGEGAAAALDRPSLAATTRAIGELPTERASRSGAGRWAIPLVLAAIVAIAALYEFSRPAAPPAAPATTSGAPAPASVPAAPSAEPAPAVQAPADAQGGAVTAPPGSASTPLPNPVASGSAAPAATPVPQATPAPAALAAVPANQLAIRFHGSSWIEVRDRTGNAVLSMTGNDGATREVAVAPPGEIVVGNVAAVEASWRGKPLDLAAQAKQSVSRVRLD